MTTFVEIAGVALVAFLTTTIATPFVAKLAKTYGLIDDPKTRPHPAHVHKKAIPRAGGLAIYIGLLLTSLIFLPLEKYLLGIFIGITILLIMGLLDDKLVKFNPYIRLILLFAVAGIAVASGIGISYITNPLAVIPNLPLPPQDNVIHLDKVIIPFNFFGPHKIIPLADIFAFLWIVTLAQVINWSKGVDGQMPGITLITALTLGFLSLKLFNQGDLNQLNVAKLAFITAGASLGFLVFNWHPAKILPGFSGSTILAFMLAVLSILSGAKIATALLVLAIPTADFVYTFCRRILSGKSPVWGDRGHLHHRLLDNLGWTPWQISLFYITGSAMLGAAALFADSESKLFVAATAAAVFIGIIIWLNSFGDLPRQPGRDNG